MYSAVAPRVLFAIASVKGPHEPVSLLLLNEKH